ncbi:HEPN domain-containing protein [Methanoculleus sp.]|uniref:HEPN domain-containing protein n=1 Tax=Methanoculleus sp. TaxID=90427 RepID=UPI001BD3AD77|nr:HEPN domain-containing protein [Methanoculleus sp.]
MEVRATTHEGKGDGDTVSFPDRLLFMAMEDLDASILLYEAGHYPQAVFLLQQAVEKAPKSFGFFFEIITEKEAVKYVRHQPLNLVKKTHTKLVGYINEVNASTQNIPEFKVRLAAIGLDLPTLEKTIKPLIHKISEYLRTLEDYDLTDSDIQKIIADLGDKSTLLDLIIQKNLDEGVQEKDYIELKEQLITAYTDSIIAKDIPEAQKTEWLQNLQASLPEIIPSKERLEYFILMAVTCVEAVHLLFQLARITAPHAERARYPDSEELFDPLDYYIPDRPIIAALPELHTYTWIALERLDHLYNLIETVAPEEAGETAVPIHDPCTTSSTHPEDRP